MLNANGAANRRGRPSVETSVLYSNTSYTLVLSAIVMQQINQL